MLTSKHMPALFIGHGNPMNTLTDKAFRRTWVAIAQSLPRPTAILCISAHWETRGTQITAMAAPRTLHDFHGFPPELFALRYPAPGNPSMAQAIQQQIGLTTIGLNTDWGLDHGCWSILAPMFPAADIPVLQLSLDRTQPAAWHYELGKALRYLRQQGVLIIGSGNIVHNLGKLNWSQQHHDWAVSFAANIKQLIDRADHASIINYQMLPAAELAVPSAEHFLPLLYVLALQEAGEEVHFFNDAIDLGAISMLSMCIGAKA